MIHAMAALQKAVFVRLKSDADLTTMIGSNRIFDTLVELEEFPYISLGRASFSDWSTSTDEGAEVVLTIHIWDRGQSRERVLQILQYVHTLMGQTDLILETGRLVTQRIEFAEVRRMPDSQDYQGLVRLRARIEIAPD